MKPCNLDFHRQSRAISPAGKSLIFGFLTLALGLGQMAFGQAPKADQANALATPAIAAAAQSADGNESQAGGITEDEIRQLLLGKTLYLRGGYLDNSLSFDEHGQMLGHSPLGSYTLSLIEINKVHLSKRKLDLVGVRYGLHFLGALPNEDPLKAVDRVRITPKKKALKITIDRELVVTPKKKKKKMNQEAAAASRTVSAEASPAPAPATVGEESRAEMTTTLGPPTSIETSGVSTTTSPAHSARLLRDAMDRVFSQGLDDRMIASMPGFWKLYYEAAAHQTDYRPADPAIYRQNTVDQKAKLLSPLDAPSNEFAQTGGVAGMALYHAVIGVDGKPQEIVVGRPIGFGLDENAADTIRKASFQPAIKDGKPVPVMLDLVIEFRIYSKRTNQPSKPGPDDAGTKLPGPYSVNHP
jgi:hypothetical protein